MFFSETYLEGEMCLDKIPVFACAKKITGKRQRGQCQDSTQQIYKIYEQLSRESAFIGKAML